MNQLKNFLITVFKWALLVAVVFAIFFLIYGFSPMQTCRFLYGKVLRVYSAIAYGIEDTSERISVTVTDPNYHINSTAETLEKRTNKMFY